MLTLNDGRNELWQWDTGRKLAVDVDCSQVHFSNKVFGRSIDVDVVDGIVIIPDILLQVEKDLTAWAFVGTPENGYTKVSKVFKVNKRNKPADYVFTPTDQTTLNEILARIEDLENRPSGDVSDEDIQNAVNDYFEKKPISIEEKDPTVPAWAKQQEKPKYTAQEVGALPSTTAIPTKPEDVNAAPKLLVVNIVNGVASHKPAQIYAHVQAGGDAITYGLIGAVHRLDIISETSAVFICNNINTTAVSKDYVVIAENGKVTIGQNHYTPTVPTTLPNPNALTFTGAVEGNYDGSKALSIEIPDTYGKSEIDAIMGSYITDIDTLVGGGS